MLNFNPQVFLQVEDLIAFLQSAKDDTILSVRIALKPREMKPLREVILCKDNVTYLCLRQSQFTYEDITELCELLKETRNLKYLGISHVRMQASYELVDERVLLAIKDNKSLEHIDLSFTFMPKQLTPITALLSGNSTLRSVDLAGSQLTSTHLHLIIEAIRTNPNSGLTRLSLITNKIEKEGFLELAEYLATNPGLKELYLFQNLGNEGKVTVVVRLLNSMASNTHLTKLGLYFGTLPRKIPYSPTLLKSGQKLKDLYQFVQYYLDRNTAIQEAQEKLKTIDAACSIETQKSLYEASILSLKPFSGDSYVKEIVKQYELSLTLCDAQAEKNDSQLSQILPSPSSG